MSLYHFDEKGLAIKDTSKLGEKCLDIAKLYGG